MSGGSLSYVLKGKRAGFEIRATDDVKHCADGYTEVRRDGVVVGVYLTALLSSTPPEGHNGE